MRREKASYEIYANHNLLFLFKDIISLWESPLCMCLVKTKEASSKVSSWRESVCGRSRKGEGLLVRFHHEGIYEWNVVRIYFGVCIMSKEIVMRFLSWGNIYVKYSEDLSWGFIMSNCFFFWGFIIMRMFRCSELKQMRIYHEVSLSWGCLCVFS